MIVSLDIGSTWTKGGAFRRRAGGWELVARAATVTTADDLAAGFLDVLRRVAPGENWDDFAAGAPPLPVRFSSSAKGGLSVAVVGLVPEMSLHIARLAALSAGARVGRAFSYKLTAADLAELERTAPDIVLLCGGTDGGNEEIPLTNARALARLAPAGAILYAGNRDVADEVSGILAGRRVSVCENIMPDLGRLNPEPARGAIRGIFLESIVAGKGLGALVRRFGAEPRPTPLSVFELVEAIGREFPEWGDFAVCDLGGATTDIYSNCDAFASGGDVVLKGVLEPRVKRSVEGDLGMRVGAAAAWNEVRETLPGALADDAETNAAFREYCMGLPARPEHLPRGEREILFDEWLAAGCLRRALLRHAGRIEEVFTSRGRVWMQSGKDLRGVRRIIGTGGYLAAYAHKGAAPALSGIDGGPGEGVSLTPLKARYFADADYLFPLLGNLVGEGAGICAATALENLRELGTSTEIGERAG